MKFVIYLCTAVIALTLAVIVWKKNLARDSVRSASGDHSVASKPPEKKTIQRGEWESVGQSHGTGAPLRFSVREFAPYEDQYTADGRAAIIVEFIPVGGEGSVNLTQNSASAQLRNGSTATLKEFRPFSMDSKDHSMRTSTLSTNGEHYVTESVRGLTRIGSFSVERYLTFGIDQNSIFSFRLSGTNAMRLGLILDAPFTDVQSVTVLGKRLQ